MVAYEENDLYLYDDVSKKILIDYDLTWKTSNGFNDRGEMIDLTEYFPNKPTLEEFEQIAKQILTDNPLLLG
ncbi:hypothetical protein CN330_24220 [Priestia megaterium]|uniref:hypothetical protein n=1 Tax=Priestia megaterium TaxID=1404 RepID=UPI000BF63F7A|nr:hypothetical protein [Priestia megaterium]PEZ08324.1 hypothetical protein CN330_24220 [Priestia megaterium]